MVTELIKRHYSILVNSHKLIRVFTWKAFRKDYPFRLHCPQTLEDVVGLLYFIVSMILMTVFVPYFWILTSLFCLSVGYIFSIYAYKVFPRDRNKLILRQFVVTLKDGTQTSMEFWIPRYAAQYTGDHYLFEEAESLRSNSRIKTFYYTPFDTNEFYYV